MSNAVESFTRASNEVLERIATGAALPVILDLIVGQVEAGFAGLVCTILLFDEAKNTLRSGAAPGLSAAFVRAVDGIPVSPDAGCCGASAYHRRPFVAEDLATHPNWVAFRALTREAGLRACWSTPIVSRERALLGTFAVYFRECRGPTDEEVARVAVATHLAAIAIVRDRDERSLRESEARARHLARLYAVSSGVNDAIARVTSRQALLDAACELAVEKGLARLAWIGVHDEGSGGITPLARFGHDLGYVDAVVVDLRNNDGNRGPAARSLRSNGPAVTNDIANDPNFCFKVPARERGFRACAVFPLRLGGGARGIFAIYADTVGYFGAEEVRVLGAVADHISSSVERAEADEERRLLFDALAERSEQLGRTDALLRIAVRAARLGGFSLEVPACRVTWSEELGALVGVPAGTTPDTNEALRVFAPEYRAIVRHHIDAASLRGTPFDFEARLAGGATAAAWVRVIGHAERDAAGAIARVQGALQDISERQRLEAQLRQSQKMEAVGQLAGGVAHDFNNLLSVVLSYAMLMADDLREADPLRASVDEILRAGERAAELTQQLLAFSRKQILHPRAIDARAVVAGLERMLQRLLGADIDLSLLAAPGVGHVFADPGQFEQVLMNLVVNARDAMPAGGSLTVELTDVALDAASAAVQHGLAPGVYVSLAVSDTGVGMDAATLSHIFEPFFTTKESGKGTGLGLSTVYGIVSQSGGHIEAESEVGRGTTFRVYLPRFDDAPHADAVEPSRPGSLRGEETVLVVEDEAQVRTLVHAVLRRAGYHVITAQNGGEAFLICEKFASTIDLMVTDVVMPRMSGRELAARLAPVRPAMKVLYMSGYTADSSFHRGALEPGTAFLSKPVRPEALLRRVREVLDAG